MIEILKMVHTGLQEGDDRYEVIDHEHFIDTQTGVKYHLYPDDFHMTHDGEVIMTSAYLGNDEKHWVRALQTCLVNRGVKIGRAKFEKLYTNDTSGVVTAKNGY